MQPHGLGGESRVLVELAGKLVLLGLQLSARRWKLRFDGVDSARPAIDGALESGEVNSEERNGDDRRKEQRGNRLARER